MADKIATRAAYGEFLVEKGAVRRDLVVMDADLSGSTKTKGFAQAYPERFINCSEATLLTQTGSRITPLFLIWLPFVLLAMLDGKRGVKQLWPIALTAGIGMAVGHFVTAHFISYELTAVVGALLAFALIAGPQ